MYCANQFNVAAAVIYSTPIWLVYVWLIAMLVQRVTVCVMGIMVCIQHHNQPTIKAKVQFEIVYME